MTRRSEVDLYGRKKFSTQLKADGQIIEDVQTIAQKHNASMSAIPLAGATKPAQIQGLAEASQIKLSKEDMETLQQHYVPHVLTGVLAEHTRDQDCYEAYGVYDMKEIMHS